MKLSINSYPIERSGVRSKRFIIPVMLLFLVLIALVSLSVGAISIPAYQIFGWAISQLNVIDNPLSAIQETVLLNIRLPRIIVGIAVGGALGVSGAALQGLFRNPLVEPGLIGISGGASLMAVLAIVLINATTFLGGFLGKFLLPIFAFSGSLGAALMAYKLSRYKGKTGISTLILVGVAVNAIVYALIGLVLYFADDAALRAYTFWNLGDLGGATWDKIIWFGPLMVLPQIFLAYCYKGLDGFALGETEAFYLGIKVERIKYLVIVLSALAVGSAVSIAGTIGFIGLVVPHILRNIFGSANKIILAGSIICGGGLLIISDLIARTIASPAEVPIGIITALLGAPFFIYLLVNNPNKNFTS